ncbi:hypothetical protein Q3G72_017164 [Acer saccharum]|nr:hypothetical protein Q3G72_017164 [Acer saccharum]
MYATLASRNVDCCIIPESPFYLEAPGGIFEFIGKRLKKNGLMVIVITEGADMHIPKDKGTDASGNKLLQDVGLWISPKNKGFTVSPVNGGHATGNRKTNKVVIRILSSTNQPSFLDPKDISRSKTEEESETKLSRH